MRHSHKIHITAVLALGMLFVTIIVSRDLYRDISIPSGSLGGQAVGISISIPQNEINSKAQVLLEKERELETREALLKESETLTSGTNANRGSDIMMMYVSAIGTLLLLLVLLNFYLDWKRSEIREVTTV